MAFLTVADIASSLPSGYDSALAARLLLRLEQELTQSGLVFTAPSVTTRQLTLDDFYSQLINSYYFSAVSSITIKEFGGTTNVVLALNTDYVLLEHPNFASNYYAIKLLNYMAKNNHYLELTAKFGIFVDFTNSSDVGANLLKSIVIDWVIKQLSYGINNYQEISSARTGDSSISYSQVQNSQYYSSIMQDPEYLAQLDYFFVWL